MRKDDRTETTLWDYFKNNGKTLAGFFMIFGKEPLLVLCYQYRSFHLLCQPTRSELNVAGGGSVVLIEESANVSLRTAVMVRVEDVDAHYGRARRSGAKIVRQPTDYPYGERQYNVEDFAGHHWCFSQSIADVDPREWGGTPAEL